ncbi:Phosphate starvation-inducible protein PhoH [Mucinivorans hirudinis]|uniref:PhoH-like protein n=1 Tax=Mucinivorans hirudinis TaxID=1433126 RepID=A0A060R7K4_9BACT|nr:Phosphate starvation-inducible protein PhoH [Mucinivorans hirudinis]
MHEKIIEITGIHSQELYGVKNANINHINAKFPLLKVIVRGDMVKVIGAADQQQAYQAKLYELIDYHKKFGHISLQVIDRVYQSNLLNRPAEDSQQQQSDDVIVHGVNGNIVKARTKNQQKLVALYSKNDMLFAIGPAGSGKTYTAIALAVRALKNKEIKRIILTRPAVEAGEKLGFLPGDMKEKLDPYLQPLYDALGDMMPLKKLNEYLVDGVVQIAPLAYMRGRTLDNACVVLDEAQNTTSEQLKMFLTRMGRSAKFIITGDVTQIDLPRKGDSGLMPAVELFRKIKGIGIVEFEKRDILRHPLVEKIVAAYEQ